MDVKDVITYVKKHGMNNVSEEATKQFIILRAIHALGWDVFSVSDVYPEYSVQGGRVDYALMYNGKPQVFIEVKKVGESLVNHQEQLLNYAFKNGVPLAVLTNGIEWWFYLPLKEGDWKTRRFITVDIRKHSVDFVSDTLIKYLSKSAVVNGTAVQKAEKQYEWKGNFLAVKDVLPEVWQEMVEKADSGFVDLLADRASRKLGYDVNKKAVIEFITTIPRYCYQVPNKKNNISKKEKVRKVDIADKEFFVTSNKEMIVDVCGVLNDIYKTDFNKVLSLRGRLRKYFSTNPQELLSPAKIPDTSFFVETNFSTQGAVKFVKRIAELFNEKVSFYIVKQ